LDCIEYLPNNNSLKSQFSTSASAFEINSIYDDENEIDITQLTENITTGIPDPSNNSKLQQVLENFKSVEASPSKTVIIKFLQY
jgi:hypothetical protein